MGISAQRLDEIMQDSLFTDDEVKAGVANHRVQVEGVVRTFGFHPDRLESHRAEIREMLSQLPDDFQSDKGGGMSFLNACMDRDGNQWGEHANMEMLFALGNGLGESAWCMPKEMWAILPGGMPYVVVKKAG